MFMNLSDVVAQYLPCWLLGIWMIYFACAAGYGNMMRVDTKAVLKFLVWMIPITILRMLWLKFSMSQGGIGPTKDIVDMIPVASTLGVYWEDACFTLPLALFSLMSSSKWEKYLSKILLVLTMLSFGSGHLYQGPLLACAISFYIPYTLKLSKKYGFGTIMVCHILFDFISLSAIKLLIGG
jgi:hypothetical protein